MLELSAQGQREKVERERQLRTLPERVVLPASVAMRWWNPDLSHALQAEAILRRLRSRHRSAEVIQDNDQAFRLSFSQSAQS